MEVDKLKKKIEMKNILEDEIEEQLKELAEKAKSILIENDEIFNSGTIEPQIFKKSINFKLCCDVDFKVLNELQSELNPNKIILNGGGYQGVFSGQANTGYVVIRLMFGD
ncbi:MULTISPECIES: hypothetical protein [Methanobacterium]|uniref:Uncharacterized protein n=1 Tax=Methanobacterium bryantii TaxID=2161 RepID=A0A2A2H8J0_METBR|nr:MULTISPECIES: hypothetical protein [Methanobacterium]OEC87855.1 hypothetical protein A9507_06685 [Methanobacterium sp. A39]PAV05722.1 hypothetical protein ASJ80_08295 [Methanobacterium bryantii]